MPGQEPTPKPKRNVSFWMKEKLDKGRGKKITKSLGLIEKGLKTPYTGLGPKRQVTGAIRVLRNATKSNRSLGSDFDRVVKLLDHPQLQDASRDDLTKAIEDHVKKFGASEEHTNHFMNGAIMHDIHKAQILTAIAKKNGLKDEHLAMALRSIAAEGQFSNMSDSSIPLAEAIRLHAKKRGLGKTLNAAIDALENINKRLGATELIAKRRELIPSNIELQDRIVNAILSHEEEEGLTPEQARRISRLMGDFGYLKRDSAGEWVSLKRIISAKYPNA